MSNHDKLVSVILPSYNVVNYIDDCLTSVRKQTLRNLEIICVDAGSTDGTIDIINKHVNDDNRIVFIQSDIKSYGYQINIGINYAHGKFIAILETDDYLSEDAYEILVNKACEMDLQIIKGNYYKFTGWEKTLNKVKCNIASQSHFYNRLINPKKEKNFWGNGFYSWAGLYSKDFLISNNIKHNESLGASYQDNGFYFLTMAYCEKLYLVNDFIYNLRRDNLNSSIFNKEKVYAANKEYDFIKNELLRRGIYEKFISEYWFMRFRAYFATLNRIDDSVQKEYINSIYKEISQAMINVDFDTSLFTRIDIDRLSAIISGGDNFYYSKYYKHKNIGLLQLQDALDYIRYLECQIKKLKKRLR